MSLAPETALRELRAVFLLDAPARVERIELQLDALDRARLPSERAAAIAAAAYEAHGLSGASATLRLEPLATQLERLELALRDRNGGSDRPSSAARVRELLASIAALVAELAFQAGVVTEPEPRTLTVGIESCHHRALGSSNQKVEPFPSMLSKPIAPPCP